MTADTIFLPKGVLKVIAGSALLKIGNPNKKQKTKNTSILPNLTLLLLACLSADEKVKNGIKFCVRQGDFVERVFG